MLEIEQVCKSYGPVQALDGVSLQVHAGEMVGFVGANGAGKSTAMRIAMGLLSADSGQVHWQQRPLTAAGRLRFGYMPEQRGLYAKMRIIDQVSYFGQLHGLDRRAADTAARELIDQLQIVGTTNAVLQTLSLGNQQRVQLAAALVHDPELLILDEPFSGLDPVGVDTMEQALRARCAAGVGVLFSSHQLDLVERLCDRIVIITAGKIVAHGTLDELRGNAARRELEVTVRDAPARWWNAVPGVVDARLEGDTVRLRLADPELGQAVLAAATRAGRVEYFGWRVPPLGELYREAVKA